VVSADAPAAGVHRALAPAKINLGLFLGPVRASDGRHELVTVMQSVSLADELTLEAAPTGSEHDEVLSPGVPGAAEENLAAVALRLFREATGWRAPPLRLSVVKRIPVAAGMGGGSADAAATLRLAAHASGLVDASSPEGERLLGELAVRLGADVPAQVAPGRWLARGAGERLAKLAPPTAPFGVLVLPLQAALSTAAVYAQADKLGLGRTADELRELGRAVHAALEDGAALPADRGLLDNDLQPAAVSLCPQIEDALAQAGRTGAQPVFLSGSGPTVLGLFAEPSEAQAAAMALAEENPPPTWATPVDSAFARVRALGPSERRPRA
jgi:4-diphosphocytidyl-2-C-methyl-D-erythritol kinase